MNRALTIEIFRKENGKERWEIISKTVYHRYFTLTYKVHWIWNAINVMHDVHVRKNKNKSFCR